MGQVVSEYCVEQLGPKATDHYWPVIEKELDKVPHIWRERWTKDGLHTGVLNGTYQLWTAGGLNEFNVVVFTSLGLYEAEKVLCVFLAFGNKFDELFPILEASLTKFAQQEHCHCIDVIGREGFKKWLEPAGFEKSATIFSRKVQQLGVH